MVKFSEYIKQKRTEAALTQDDLSELMEVSLNTVQNWEGTTFKAGCGTKSGV